MSEAGQKRKLSGDEDELPTKHKSPDKSDHHHHHHRKHSSHHKHSESEKDGESQKSEKSEKSEKCVDEQKMTPKDGRLGSEFFDVPAEDLARKILGQTIVRITPEGKRLSARIVETEAFLGEDDKASHCYQGKRSGKNEAMYMSPGTIYVYNIFGGHYCMKISSKGDGAGIMLKSVDPIDGEDDMREARASKKEINSVDLCNGPSKFCQSFQITRAVADKQDLSKSEHFWLEEEESVPDDHTVICKRINIDHAEEWRDKALRFYVLGDAAVGTRDKEAERKLKGDEHPADKTSKKQGSQHSNKTDFWKDKPIPNDDRLKLAFYDTTCEDLARKLLGQTMVRITEDGERLTARIVETEAYLGAEDKAAHSYEGKRTAKNEAMFMPPGTIYVYNVFGANCCMNISSQGDGEAVLLRSMETIDGEDIMREYRSKAKMSTTKPISTEDLCNGPSKLCQSLIIRRDTVDKQDLTKSDILWLEEGDTVADDKVVKCKRINIEEAGEWKDKPLRFYICGNTAVSVRDKDVEKELKKNKN